MALWARTGAAKVASHSSGPRSARCAATSPAPAPRRRLANTGSRSVSPAHPSFPSVAALSLASRTSSRCGDALRRAQPRLHGLAEGIPSGLLDHTTGKLKAPRPRLLAGLRGAVTDHHRFMFKLHLRQIDSLESGIRQLERQMEKLLRPFRERVEQLSTIPGVSHTAAQTLIPEIGLDMTRFPTSGHLVSWAGLCPRMDDSAGKRRSNRTRQGTPWLKTTPVMAG